MSLLLPRFTRDIFRAPLKYFISQNSLSCISSHDIISTTTSTRHGKATFKSPNLNGWKRYLHTCSRRLTSESSVTRTEAEKLSLLNSQMNLRVANENCFLSWCRNAYLSTVVGLAMMEQGTSTLVQGAGFGAFLIAGMNLLWGTGSHVTTLFRLRHASGMSTINLGLNVCGSIFHFCLFFIVLVFYMGFLDERRETQSGTRKNSDFEEV